MRDRKRLTALILCVIMLFSLSSCTFSPFESLIGILEDSLRSGGTSFDDMEYVRPDIDNIRSIKDSICDLLDEGAGFREVTAELDSFYREYWTLNTMFTLASIRSDLDTGDSYYAEEYDYCAELDAEVSTIFTELMVYCADSSLAAELDENYFNGMLAENYSDGYDDGFEVLNGLYAQESELLTRYRTLLVGLFNYGEEDVYEKYNEEMCKIYIELVKIRNDIAEEIGYSSYEEMAYADFGREYSPEDIEELQAAVKEYIVPLYLEVLESGTLEDVFYALERNSPSNSLSTVCRTVAAMDSSMGRAASYMRNFDLCDVDNNEDKMETSYTVYIDDYNSPYMFVSTAGYEEDMLTIAHEFGHYTDFYQNYNMTSSLDTSETLSQGLEYLLLSYLDDSDLSDRLAAYKMADTIQLLVNQTGFNEFEHRVFSLSEDELTVDNVNRIYAECANSYGFGTKYDNVGLTWVDINHFFEYPFYVISYTVSDIAAFNIYCMELDGKGDGLAAYLKLMDDAENFDFAELLDSAGIASPLSAAAIKDIAEVMEGILDLE